MADSYQIIDPPIPIEEWSKNLRHFGKVENLEENRIYRSLADFDKFTPNSPGFAEKSLPELIEGEELYYWDDIRILSGNAGFLVVKDGMAIRKNKLIMA